MRAQSQIRRIIHSLNGYLHHEDMERLGSLNAAPDAPILMLDAFRNQLKQAISRERTIADHSTDLVCAFDDKYNIAAINQTSTRLLGFSSHDMLHLPVSRVIVDSELLENRLKAAQDSGGPSLFETRALTKSGQLLDLSWMVEWSKREQMFFAIARDITMKRSIERARQEFVAMISHDVRIPLTSILCGLATLSENTHEELQDESHAVITRAEENITRVIDLLNELIDLEKSVDSRLLLELSDFNVRSLIDTACKQLTSQAEQLSVSIEVRVDNLYVRADRNRILRVLVNLLSNSLKHSSEGQSVLISALERQSEIEVRISDRGPGVPQNMQLAIFERFVQLGLTGERGGPGSGLGLAICKVFVEAHGCSIGVDSEPGKGSTFWFTLPRKKDIEQLP